MTWIKQQTLRSPVTLSGRGLHSGQPVSMTIHPQDPHEGISFVRDSLVIAADYRHLEDTHFCTSLNSQGRTVRTIEHFLSAAVALGLDNLKVSLDADELPCLDGSAYDFYWAMQCAGIQEQNAPKEFYRITKPVEIDNGQSHGLMEPYSTPYVSITLNYKEKVITQGGLSMSFCLFSDDYASQVARARTYGFEKDFEFFKKNKLAQGATLENCLVLDDQKALSPGGLRFPNEAVRHKILDVFGDLALLGKPFLGRYTAYKPGHSLNLAMVKKLVNQEALERVCLSTKETPLLKGHCPHG